MEVGEASGGVMKASVEVFYLENEVVEGLILTLALVHDLSVDVSSPAYREEAVPDGLDELDPQHAVEAVAVVEVPVAEDFIGDTATRLEDLFVVAYLAFVEELHASVVPCVEDRGRDLALP